MKYRDNNITGVDFDDEVVQQNWQGRGSEGSVSSGSVQVGDWVLILAGAVSYGSTVTFWKKLGF